MNSFTSNMLMGDGRLSRYLIQPLVNFSARFYIAYIFFNSGLKKIDDDFKITTETIKHFKDDFKVPFIPPEIAAYLATYAELTFPVLLVLGLFSRISAMTLFVLNAIALFSLHTAGWTNAVSNWEHIFYGSLLLLICTYGPSSVSIDSCLSERLKGNNSRFFFKVTAIAVLSGIAYYLLDTYL